VFYQRTQYAVPVSAPATLKQDIQASASKKAGAKMPTPAEYFRSKNRSDGIAQVLIFGKFLEEFRGQGDFSRQDINKIAAEAKTKDIHGQYFSNAVKQGLLRSVGRARYSLTLSAEAALAGMK